MDDFVDVVGAVQAPNQYVNLVGRRLAYRSIGTGKPIVLCNRFRGTMDTWDPAFLDALAGQGLRVITFDYSGLGLSTGDRSYNPLQLTRDANDLLEALDLRDAVISGWSIGGLVAQVMLAMHPQRLTHVVLLATSPPGPLVKAAEQIFFDTARRAENTFEETVVLFFEPRSEASRAAARRSVARIAQRPGHLCPLVPWDWAAEQIGGAPKNPVFPVPPVLQALRTTSVPVLHVGADHDIAFPVENWYALNGQLPTLRLLTFPQAGHAPHHQHPVEAAQHITTFVRGEQ